MSTIPRLTADMTSRKGEAKPPPEPALRRQRGLSRRVGTHLSTDLYVRFKSYVARHGLTGEQVIAIAIEQLIGSG
jgi:hypothetical protein